MLGVLQGDTFAHKCTYFAKGGIGNGTFVFNRWMGQYLVGMGATVHSLDCVDPVGRVGFFIWRAANDKTSLAQVREPHVSIRDENLESVIVAELPGVGEEEISINVEEGFIVSIETTGARKYATTVPLSETVNAATLRKTYQNGLLELRLQKA